MEHERPDPDLLLKQLQLEEDKSEKKGRLKIFLGAAAGVGKTYSMLSDAHEQRARGVDVMIGFIETHGRKETEAMVSDLPMVPLRNIHYRGTCITEFDIDAALGRHPDLILVDELPHTNAPESRHPKRWMDVEELLSAGINVYTAVNIQHIESLRDVVAQVTGVFVKETVPDAFIERADEIELIDIPPDELRQRLKEGKVYVPERVDQAMEGFFKKGNLLALRELALRRTADRVDAEIQSVREGVHGMWTTRERVLVCIAPNRLGERVVRTAARLGNAVHAKMFALYVESDRQSTRTPENLARAEEALRLADRMGMETERRTATDIVSEILDYAHRRGITLIVVGKPIKARWREVLLGSVVDELVRKSGDININVITSEETAEDAERVRPSNPIKTTFKDYAWAVAGAVVATAIGTATIDQLPGENAMALYFLAIAYTAARTSPQATAACCVICVGAYDFFFVHPRYTFSVSDVRYLPTFGIMLLVALLISRLTIRLRQQADAASARERRTAALYDLTREMSRLRTKQDIVLAAARKIRDELDIDTAVFLPNESGDLRAVARSLAHFEKDHNEWSVAQWCFAKGELAGSGTDTLPGSKGLYLPLVSGNKRLGVLALKPMHEEDKIDPAHRTLLQTFANGIALAVERTELAKESHEARVSAEAERIRSSLLSSVSHDIRSPLTAIAGAASSLVEGQGDERELARTIYDESQRLNRHVRNLLDMTRLESGHVKPNLEWNSLEELVGSAITRTETQLADREVSTDLSEELPLVKVDGLLIEQVVVNLLENAARHTPPKTSILVKAFREGSFVRIEVADQGPGVPIEVRPHLFEKFRQARDDQEGFGLGLAIAKAIVQIHQGEIRVDDRPGGGSVFSLTIPIGEGAPEVPVG